MRIAQLVPPAALPSRTILRLAAAIVGVALASGARAGERSAVIWGGGSEAMARWQARAPAAGVKLAEGFPRIVDSGSLQGLERGNQLVLLGFCDRERAGDVLIRLNEMYELYVPEPYLVDGQTAPLACPELLPRAAVPALVPGQALHALVVASGRSRADLEAQAAKLQKASARLRLAPGYPAVERRERLPLRSGGDDPYWFVLGVCPAGRAGVLGSLVEVQTEELQGGTPACPDVLEAGRAEAIRLALLRHDPRFALELLARPGALSDADRRSLALVAAQTSYVDVLDKLMAAGPIDATAALGEAIAAAYSHSFALERTVRRLLAGGAVARGRADWIAMALERTRLLPEVKQLAAAGADPRGAAARVVAAAASDPEALAWVVSQRVDLDVRDAEGETALDRAALKNDVWAVRALLGAGASPSIRGKDGLTPLDRVLLPGREVWPELRDAMLEGRPAFAAAARGDVEALAALPAASLDEAWGGWTPLAVAALHGQDPAALFLLDHGARADLRVAPGQPDGEHDVLSLAIEGGAPKLALRLILRGGPLDTPAGSCAFARIHDRVKLRANEEFPDATGKRLCVKLRPIHRAALFGPPLVMQALLMQRVDPDATDASGLKLTATMLAAEAGRVEMFKPLAAKGARIGLADAGGYGAVAHAFELEARGVKGKDVRPVLDAIQAAFGPKAFEAAPNGLIMAVRVYSTALERLLDAGAGQNGEGKRALQAACDQVSQSQFDALRSRGYSIGKQFQGGCFTEGPN